MRWEQCSCSGLQEPAAVRRMSSHGPYMARRGHNDNACDIPACWLSRLQAAVWENQLQQSQPHSQLPLGFPAAAPHHGARGKAQRAAARPSTAQQARRPQRTAAGLPAQAAAAATLGWRAGAAPGAQGRAAEATAEEVSAVGPAVRLQLPCWLMGAQGIAAAAALPAAAAQGSAAGRLQLPCWQMRALAAGSPAAAIQGLHLPLRWLVGVLAAAAGRGPPRPQCWLLGGLAAAAGRDQNSCLAQWWMPALRSCLEVFLLQGMQSHAVFQHATNVCSQQGIRIPCAALCQAHSHKIDEESNLAAFRVPQIIKLPGHGGKQRCIVASHCSTPNCLATRDEQEQLVGTAT